MKFFYMNEYMYVSTDYVLRTSDNNSFCDNQDDMI